MSKLSSPQSIASVQSVPWKNGSGITRTLAVEPPDAGLDDFLWRVSIAEIAGSSDFSSFEGIDRNIMLWQGVGVVLRSTAWPEHSLTSPWEPFAFRGEDEVTCDLIEGVTEDLNLMSRRGKVEAKLLTYRSGTILRGPFEDVVILCARGEIAMQVDGNPKISLHAGSFLRASRIEGDVAVVMAQINSVYVCCLIA